MESDSPFARLIGYMQETLLGSGGSPQSYRIRERKYVYSIPNCNVAYVADILRNEEYDNRLSMGDDCDLNYRLRRKGYRFLYIPDAVVWHRRPTNLKQFLKKMFRYGEGMAKVTKKNRAVVRWYAFGPALMVMGLLGAYPLVRFVPGMAYVYIAMAGIYLAGLFVSTAQVFRKIGSLTAVRITILLPVQHMSYGLGFLKGLLTERYVKEEG
jgi:cellulose synthase/poly-beta-1,6-N-acetylglucosamine synthase-like glycosyltransferase